MSANFLMHVIFVHGWSVQNTDTYGGLPAWLQQKGAQFQVQNVYLGKYISFNDTVTVDDIARAFDAAVREALGASIKEGFACITHSTGGPVIRKWMDLYYRGKLKSCPMSHLIMLAPANHGSALAQLGKGRLNRLKTGLLEDAQPGVRVLDWLELGSEQSWALNEAWLGYDCLAGGVYPFVLTGQSIDRSFYDHLNSYTDEAGSDGVVRVAAANMNYSLLRLHQDGDTVEQDIKQHASPMALGVLPGLSHSGKDMGIIRSVTTENAANHPTAKWVLRCLQIASAQAYASITAELAELTAATQDDERTERVKKLFGSVTYHTSRYSMIVFRLIDDRGDVLTDYDLYITAGPNYSADELPTGFFVDRQRNQRNPGKLTYYVDYDVLIAGLAKPQMEGKLGFKIVARPTEGDTAVAFYKPVDFRSDATTLSKILHPNETLMVEIKMARLVDAAVFRVENNLTPTPISGAPLNSLVP